MVERFPPFSVRGPAPDGLSMARHKAAIVPEADDTMTMAGSQGASPARL
jgi:hypothetical protein